jgi:hypothetical protein
MPIFSFSWAPAAVVTNANAVAAANVANCLIMISTSVRKDRLALELAG